MKNKRIFFLLISLLLLLFPCGCTIKVDEPSNSSIEGSNSSSEKLMRGFGGYDTKPHGVKLPKIQ